MTITQKSTLKIKFQGIFALLQKEDWAFDLFIGLMHTGQLTPFQTM